MPVNQQKRGLNWISRPHSVSSRYFLSSSHILSVNCAAVHTDVDKLSLLSAGFGLQGNPMDNEFYRQRAKHIRELALQADPLIKKRLLRLASNYENMLVGTEHFPSSPGDPAVVSSKTEREAKS
jgi:hypothetical protein